LCEWRPITASDATKATSPVTKRIVYLDVCQKSINRILSSSRKRTCCGQSVHSNANNIELSNSNLNECSTASQLAFYLMTSTDVADCMVNRTARVSLHYERLMDDRVALYCMYMGTDLKSAVQRRFAS
jgi:hypothetical protein